MDNRFAVKVQLLDDTLGIITISGEVGINSGDFELFSKEISAYLKMGIYKYVIDMNNVSYLDSSGLGVLIRLATNASRQNTRICVICDHPHVKRVMTISNVDKIIQFVHTIQDGLQFYKTAA